MELEERAPLRGLKREREAAQAAPLKEPKKEPTMLPEAEQAGLPPSDGRFDEGVGSTSTMAEDCQQLPSPPARPARIRRWQPSGAVHLSSGADN